MQPDNTNLRVIAIFAHPDDGEVKMGATAAMLADTGYHIKFLSITNGDAGHHNQGGGALARRRKAEAQEAARRLGISAYTILGHHDGELLPEYHIRMEVIREIRTWEADVVIGLRPWDYHPDHRYAGRLVQDAAYMVQVPNVAPNTSPLTYNPVFLYMEDGFKNPYPLSHDIVIGVDSHIDQKIDALDAHESQFYEWLPWVEGVDGEIPEDSTGRKKWMASQWIPEEVSDEQRKVLVDWYGEEKGSVFRYAESFEICEYGYQPDREEIQRIFPMLDRV